MNKVAGDLVTANANLSTFFLVNLGGNSNSWVEGIIVGVLVGRNTAQFLLKENALISVIEIVDFEVGIIFVGLSNNYLVLLIDGRLEGSLSLVANNDRLFGNVRSALALVEKILPLIVVGVGDN